MFFTSAMFLVCSGGCRSSITTRAEDILSLPKDKEIAERILDECRKDRKLPAGELMVKVASSLLETPYVAHTLETGKEEKMVINLRELDCTTFVENCLALTRTIRSGKSGFDHFVSELENIRYRNGSRDGYPSRLHYFSDWLYDNEQKKIILNISRDMAHTIMPNRVNFMSTHPGSYRVLSENPDLVPAIASQENEISGRMTWFIPKAKLPDLEAQLNDGDIIAFTTFIEGLDISHVAIAVRKNGQVRFYHASSKLNKVVLSEETLAEYLNNSKMASGIMVARAL